MISGPKRAKEEYLSIDQFLKVSNKGFAEEKLDALRRELDAGREELEKIYERIREKEDSDVISTWRTELWRNTVNISAKLLKFSVASRSLIELEKNVKSFTKMFNLELVPSVLNNANA